MASALMANDLMYKHWDRWVESVPHPFFAPFDGETLGEATDILEGTLYESPMLPFGDINQLCWSTDSKKIAYTCKKKIGKEYALSTDSDIYIYNIETKEDLNICKIAGNPDQHLGYEINPAYSKSGKYIAWLSMEHDGYESDKNRLCVFNLKTQKSSYLTNNFDADVSEFCWDENMDFIYFTSVRYGRTMIYKVDLKGNITQITVGDYDYFDIQMCGEKIISIRQSLLTPSDLYIIEPANFYGIKQLTFENEYILNQRKIGKGKEGRKEKKRKKRKRKKKERRKKRKRKRKGRKKKKGEKGKRKEKRKGKGIRKKKKKKKPIKSNYAGIRI